MNTNQSDGDARQADKAVSRAKSPQCETSGSGKVGQVPKVAAVQQRSGEASDVLQIIGNERRHLKALIDIGKGEYGTQGYVRDETWSNWHYGIELLDRIVHFAKQQRDNAASSSLDGDDS